LAEQKYEVEKKQQAQIDALYPSTTTSAAPMTFGGGGGGSSIMNPPPTNALIQGSTPALSPNMLRPDAQTPAAAPAPVAATGDVYDQIKALDAQIARLPLNNPRSIPMLTALNQQRTQLLASAKQQYGGDTIDMTVENPAKPGTYMTVKGTRNQRGVYEVAKQGEVPISYDLKPNSTSENIDPSVVRPPPRAGYQYNAKGEEVRIPQTGVPEGVRLKPDERWNETKQVVEQVPGSAAFIEQQTKHGKDLGALKTTQATTKWGTERIDKILDPKNKTGFENNFGGFTAYATKELSGNTAKVKTELDSLKSDLKNKGLQMFRAGGSIGAMTEKEWPIVESMLATITPKMDVKDAREVLEAVRVKFETLENLAAEKYNDQWKGTQYHKPVSTTSSGAAPALTGEDKAAMDWANANPKDPRAAQIRQRLGG
jgi:hypothetical protein